MLFSRSTTSMAVAIGAIYVLFAIPAIAAPTVSGNTISWPDDGYYQVLSRPGFDNICEATTSCDVEPGNYIVINHTTDERFEVEVTEAATDTGNGSGNGASEITVTGNVISWPDNGWYQVQDQASLESLCEGGLSCLVPNGTYIVINHTTDIRYTGIEVQDGDDVVVQPDANLIGDSLELGDGTVNAYYRRDANGNPEALGVNIKASAFENPPTAMSDGKYDIIDSAGNIVFPCCGTELVLPMPSASTETPFKQIIMNYNPHGHIPHGVYNVPHMDFHFYLIDEEERQTIDAPTAEERCPIPDSEELAVLNCEDYELALRPVPADTLAPGYQSVGALEPSMGNHMLDLSSPEFNERPFTHTWIYGAWKGQVHFFEPMVTVDYLKFVNHFKTCVHYPTAEAQPTAGWYPTKYCMNFDEDSDSYQISLEAWRTFPQTSSPASE